MMIATTPQVFLIGEPMFAWEEARRYLHEVHGQEWIDRIEDEQKELINNYHDGQIFPHDVEAIIEFAGRMCYRSWKPQLNKNVTKVRTARDEYFSNLLKSGHGSVLEHGFFTFIFHNVSRVFTHELVRHRVGVAISQESLRYVRLADEIPFWTPSVIKDYPMVHARGNQLIGQIEEFLKYAYEEMGLDDEKANFHFKKTATSALRRYAPDGLSTGIVWSANVRSIRHVLEMRTAAGAEEEIRLVFNWVGKIMQDRVPLLFADYSVNSEGEWTTENRKV